MDDQAFNAALTKLVQGTATGALELVSKLLSNVIAKQEEPKYRRVRTSNAKLDATLFSVPGGRDLMLACGFTEAPPDELVLPESISLVRLLQHRNAIDAAIKAPAAVPPPSQPGAMDVDPPAAEAMAEDDDEAMMLAQALALSREGAGGAPPAEEDDDDMLEKALALSRENDGMRAAPAPAPAPALDAQARLQARVRELFTELAAGGMAPNEAAAQALERATREAKSAAAPPPAPPPLVTQPSALLEKEGFEARVKELFAAHKAAGAEANEAAANALKQAQQEQLAEAQRARADRAGGEGGGSDVPAGSPPGVTKQGSEAIEKFERWEEIERVAQVHVDAILELFRTDGVKFVDPAFPPVERSLYSNPDTATHWSCRACGRKNPLPPPPSDQELFTLMTRPEAASQMITCAHCASESSKLETALRPTGWSRPGDLPGIRDDVTLQHSSVPWVVIRDEPRPDDIRQGHVGNCWFVCAMSALAEEPANIRRILLTTEHTHAGVYQVKLCHNGEWQCVLIDDVFPVNALSCLAYLKAARRSLWCSLIEKAAAKLHGSYEALNGGTFSEAFSMLSGMPVQNIRLARYREPEPPPMSASDDERKGFEKRLGKWRAKGYDLDELYAQLYSFRTSGFVIGCSTFFHTDKEIAEARATGIQVPHAYCLLELANCDGEDLVKMRNPNGHAGWKGEWSRGSSKWTYDNKLALGLDKEDSGVFWMAWADFTRLFAEVCVCRLMPNHLEARQGGWLPSVFGAGQAVEIEVYAHTQVELSLHQEAHSNRGEASFATLKDLGLAVIKLPGDTSAFGDDGGGGGGGSGGGSVHGTLVAYGERSAHSSLSIDTTLESDGFTNRYLVMPLCFGNLGSPEPRKFTLAALSTQPLSVETVALPAATLAAATIQVACKHGEKTALLSHPMFGEMLNVYSLEEEGGWAIVAENLSPSLRIRVELDASDHTRNFHSSRGALFCEDVLPPRHRMVLMVFSIDMSKKSHGFSLRYGGGALQPTDVLPPGAGHIPALDDAGANAPLHEPQPMGAGEGRSAPMPQQPPPTGDVDVASLAASIMSQIQPRR